MPERSSSNGLRITILTQFFDPEPAAMPGLSLAKWLIGRGHQVQVVTGFPNYPGGRIYPGYRVRPFRREVVEGVNVLRVMLYPSHDRSAIGRVLNYLSFSLSAAFFGSLFAGRSDVTYVYHPPATVGLPALIWRIFREQSFVFHVQDVWPESVVGAGMVRSRLALRLLSGALSAWCSLIYRQASAVAVISPGMKTLIESKGVPADKVAVIMNWADEGIFHPMDRDENLARSLGLDGCFNVIYAGNLGPYQSLDTAVRAANRVRHLEDFQLVIVGTGQSEEELRDLVRELQLDNVRFLGRIPYEQMGRVTNLASILLVSLRDLPFFKVTVPGKTQVGLSCGKPIVVAVSGEAARVVESAGAGFSCPPDDDQALAEAFETAYRMDPADLDRMGEQGRQYYLREFSFATGVDRIERLLIQAAAKRGS